MIILLGLVLIGGAVWWFRRGTTGTGGGAVTGSAPAVPAAVATLAAKLDEDRSVDGGSSCGRLVLRGLIKRYGAHVAVDGLSCTVQPGRITGFLGPNGAGKTTTLRMIVGLVLPSAGTVTIGGARFVDLGEPLRRVGAVLEGSAAHPGRTGRDHLRVLCRSAGIPLARADEVLALVGLSEAGRRPFKSYSLGMRQRLGIAAALVGDPQVLILDEPTNGLDPEGIRWMHDLLTGLAADGRTILVASHQLAEMQALADDLIIIAGGQVVAQGTVTAVIDSMTPSGRTLVRTPDLEQLAAALHALDTRTVITPGRDGMVAVSGPGAAAIGDAARRAGITLHQLATEQPDLETVFLELTAPRTGIQ